MDQVEPDAKKSSQVGKAAPSDSLDTGYRTSPTQTQDKS